MTKHSYVYDSSERAMVSPDVPRLTVQAVGVVLFAQVPIIRRALTPCFPAQMERLQFAAQNLGVATPSADVMQEACHTVLEYVVDPANLDLMSNTGGSIELRVYPQTERERLIASFRAFDLNADPVRVSVVTSRLPAPLMCHSDWTCPTRYTTDRLSSLASAPQSGDQPGVVLVDEGLVVDTAPGALLSIGSDGTTTLVSDVHSACVDYLGLSLVSDVNCQGQIPTPKSIGTLSNGEGALWVDLVRGASPVDRIGSTEIPWTDRAQTELERIRSALELSTS